MKKPQLKLFCVMSLPGVRSRLHRPLGAPPAHLAKYDVCTLAENHSDSRIFVKGPKRNQPHIRGADFFWNPATSYSPGRSAMALLRPLGAAMAEPNQVQCMHVGWDGQKIDIS